MTTLPQESPNIWFYEDRGERKGGVSEAEIIALIQSGSLNYGSSVWRKGFPDWLKLENTELRPYLEELAPPPLTGALVSNTIVWVLAFAPIIGFILEHVVAGVVYEEQVLQGGINRRIVEASVSAGEFWYVTVILNCALSHWDETRLKKAGIDNKKLRGWVFIVPVYLYQRAVVLKQSIAYFVVWMISFLLAVSM